METRKWLLRIARLIAFLAVVAISLYVFSIRERAEEFAVYGYPGIFLISLLSYATVLLPAPGVAIVFAMGGVFNPVGVALAASTGAALGESVGYLAGFSGQGIVERTNVSDKLFAWMKKNGPLTIFIMSAIPNPFFDMAGVAAGALKMPYLRFLIWCWLGQLVKMSFFAFTGASSINRIFGT
jgi:uncharacterized membrane protein YdjX (TVP38/TMEM64 family)